MRAQRNLITVAQETLLYMWPLEMYVAGVHILHFKFLTLPPFPGGGGGEIQYDKGLKSVPK